MNNSLEAILVFSHLAVFLMGLIAGNSKSKKIYIPTGTYIEEGN